MAKSSQSPAPFTAGEALEAFRRVKLSSASGTQVEYADQSDSDNFIGWTAKQTPSGEAVAIILKGMTQTVVATASEALAVGATLYAADDGKVADTSSGNSLGTALQAATADDSNIEILPDNGGGSTTSPASVADYSATLGGIPFLAKIAIAGAATTNIFNANAPRKFQVIDAWSVNTSADGGTWKLTDGTSDIMDAVTTAAQDKDIDRAVMIDDANYEIAASGTLAVVSTGASLACIVYVWCLPVA